MRASERTANAVDCTNCGHTSELDEFEVDDLGENVPDCPQCDEYPIAVWLEDCPNGITTNDWIPGVGMKPGRTCDSELHAARLGKHVTEIQL